MPSNPSDLVKFKRGHLADLETLMSSHQGVDGTFYLTIDDDINNNGGTDKASRLYVGRADGSIVPVNQGIITVSTVSALVNNPAKWHAGDYAYVTGTAAENYNDGNIFAIYDGSSWKQINSVGSDTHLSTLTDDIATANGVATITTTAAMNEGSPKVSSFTVTGDNGVTVSSTAKNGATPAQLTITGDTYTLSRGTYDSTNKQIQIKLDSTNTANDSAVTLKAGNNVTLSAPSDGVIQVASTDTKVTSATVKGQSTNGFEVSIVQNAGSPVLATFDPLIKLGDNSTTYHFVGNTTADNTATATLPVYTKTEIDNMNRALNAMTYKGTVGVDGSVHGSVADSVSGITASGMPAVHVGDTYILLGDYTTTYSNITIGYSGGTAQTDSAHGGDVLIANGTEYTATDSEAQADPSLLGTIKPSTLYYDIIPAGDEKDTTYQVAGDTHGITINPYGGSPIGGIKLANTDSLITLTDSGTSSKTVTVGHANVTRSDTDNTSTATSQTAITSMNIDVITGVTTNASGHVTGVTKDRFTVIDTNATLTSVVDTVTVANNSNVAAIETTATLSHPTGSPNVQSGTFELASDNLTVTAPAVASGANPQVKVNLLWESF